MSGNSSDEDSTDRAAIPRGVLNRNQGWEGGELELERQREEFRRGKDVPSASAAVAVDLRQFRNEEVGKGYQAKGVVRQPVGKQTGVVIQDMTISNDRSSKKRKRDKYIAENLSSPEDPALERYLRCDVLRKFRKELDKIVSSA